MEKRDEFVGMMTYRRAGVASTFSPTFSAVLAEAGSFARHCGAELEIIHAAAFDAEKEKLFFEKMGRSAAIRWVNEDPPSQAIIAAAQDYDYELLIAGALQVEDADIPFTSSVARELMRDAEAAVRSGVSLAQYRGTGLYAPAVQSAYRRPVQDDHDVGSSPDGDG